jgi:hypothetical protein
MCDNYYPLHSNILSSIRPVRLQNKIPPVTSLQIKHLFIETDHGIYCMPVIFLCIQSQNASNSMCISVQCSLNYKGLNLLLIILNESVKIVIKFHV